MLEQNAEEEAEGCSGRMTQTGRDAPLIKSKARVKKFGEVFTPLHIVKQMCDMLDDENGGRAFDIDKTFLEPCCGTGNFAVEIIGRKLKKCKTPAEARTAVNSYYSVEIQEDNVLECRARIAALVAARFPTVDVTDILERNILCGDFLHPKGIWFLEEWEEEFEKITGKKKRRNGGRQNAIHKG